MEHALLGSPMNLFKQRGEREVVVGNAGVVRILRCGAAVRDLKEGDVCLVFCVGDLDDYGYPRTILGFDSPGTMGVLAKRARFRHDQLIRLPEKSALSLRQWAAFSLRYITAYSNWISASQVWRTQMEDAFPHECHVVGWGGGVSFAQLELAHMHGCPATLISATEAHRTAINRRGVVAIERSSGSEGDERLIAQLLERTGGRGASIFIDNIGANFRLTMRALARQGVITTCGWRENMVFPISRAAECIARRTHVFTHYAPRKHGLEAVEFAEARGWAPDVAAQAFAWEDIDQLASAYINGAIDDYFPIFEVNKP
ncbi:hypothetical protein ACFSE1_08765 [Rhizobium helianthi]|uniref:Zinc-binding alcohol dehydrogenase family protein n=1 Tax=Rhizobium helianthi TaxID=1132695 RepID=A0ABW4M2B2_9HYPH